MPPLLSISQLSTHFRTAHGNEQVAVRNLSLDIHAGETVALVGESGSGKSVTALSILKLLPYPQAYHPTGTIHFRDTEILTASPTTLRHLRGNRISMIFQEPMLSLNPLHTVYQQISETLLIHKGMSGKAAKYRVLELLAAVGIQDAERRLTAFPHELSGGQRQRVMIAMALANEPDLLIADEPTTALDVTIQAQILNLLQDLQHRFNMAMLFITHDLNIVHKLADRINVMYRGELVESGIASTVLHTPQHPYTQQLLNAIPPAKKIDNNQTIEPTTPPLLQAESLRVWFPLKAGILQRTVAHIKAVDNVSLTIHAGKTVGIVGESGSGKTTLGLALLRLQPSEGAIYFNRQPLHTLSNRALKPFRRDIQIVFQDPFSSLSPRLSVGQIIGEGLQVHRIGQTPAEREALIIEVLQAVGLDPASRHRYPHEFSGGQRQRIAIARAMILKPRLVILDEPTSALDRSIQIQIIELLQKFQEEYQLSYLFISHDLAVIRALSDDLIVMQGGKIVEAGTAADIFTAPQHPYTRHLLAAASVIATVRTVL